MFYIFEIANNHGGSVEHAKRIISEFGELAKKMNIRAGMKLQFRQLDTFIHKDYQDSDLKYVKRFKSTELTSAQFGDIVNHMRDHKLATIVTPFDNESLLLIKSLNIDIIKVASCSIDDWPLLREIAETCENKIIISTAGADFETLDKVYELFKRHKRNFAFMHCVGEYPTPREHANLNRITQLRERYPDIEIGFSTHESPNEPSATPIASVLGCTIVEKHVGVEAEGFELNAYSNTPEQMEATIQAVKDTQSMFEGLPTDEHAALQSLKRGVYASRDIKKGDVVRAGDVYFAMPCQQGQANASHIDQIIGHGLECDISADGMITLASCKSSSYVNLLAVTVASMNEILDRAGITIYKDDEIELSAHYGIDAFEFVGAAIVNKVNREYCKKLIVQLPGQVHPSHRHIKKEETFELLWGDCLLTLADKEIEMEMGRPYVIMRGVTHSFKTKSGCVVEEVSTTHVPGDSIYDDPSILKKTLAERKIIVK